MSLFEKVQSQYIDDNGKTRMLRYRSGVCLMTSPIPPLNAPIDKEINEVSWRKAEKFIKSKGLVITMQDGSIEEKQIQGLWVESQQSQNSGIYYGYIPIKVSDAIPDVDFVPPFLNDPLRTDRSSELRNIQSARKVADFLKQYTLYEYSLDAENFDEDSFVIDPDHQYDVDSLQKRLYQEGNSVMYSSSGKLIVSSEEIRDKLLSFLRIQLFNNTPGVMTYKDRAVVKDYYRTLSDFRRAPGQLIFLSKQNIIRWKLEKSTNIRNEIVTYLRPDLVEPYFYRNSRVLRGNIVLIQNVEDGLLDGALSVAEKWSGDPDARINPGFKADIVPNVSKISFTVFTEDGEQETVDREGDRVYVLEYPDKKYGAILPL